MKTTLLYLFVLLTGVTNVVFGQCQGTILYVSDISYPSGDTPPYTHVFQLNNGSSCNAIGYHFMPFSAEKMVNGNWVQTVGLNTTFDQNYFTLYSWDTDNITTIFTCTPNDGIGHYKLYFSIYDSYNNCLSTLPGGHLNTEFDYYPEPSGVSVYALSSTSMYISWNSLIGADYYKVYRNGSYISTIYAGSSYADNDLTPDTEYCYKIKAYDSYGNTGYSSSDCDYTDSDVPNSPAGINATTLSSSSIQLSWSTVSGTTYYNIYRDGNLLTTDSGSPYIDNSLSPSTNYCYMVKACNSTGCSGYSSQDCATTSGIAPSIPGGVSATTLSNSSIQLSWSTVSGTTYYNIYRDGNLLTTDSGSPYIDNSLSPSTNYCYMVKACNSTGCSGYSSQDCATTQANASICNAVRLSYPRANAVGIPKSAKLDWEMSSFPNAYYEVLVTDADDNMVFSSSTITETYYQFAIGTLLYDQTYNWKVRALVDDSAVSEWANVNSFTIKPSSPDQPNYGAALGHFNDAVIFKNHDNFSGYYQCVEFVKRYQNVVYGLSMPAIGNADVYFWNSQIGFSRYYNGGQFIPQVGDLVCLSGGSYGHVAIVRNVEFSDDGIANDYVEVAQQNMGSNINNHVNQQVGLLFEDNKFTIDNFAGKTVDGWRRAMPTVFSPYNHEIFSTTTPLVDWKQHTSPQSYRVDASKLNTATGCYEPISNFNGATVYTDYYIFPSGILEAGSKYRLRIGITTQSAGFLQTEPIYFEITSSANNTPPLVGQYVINTMIQSDMKDAQTAKTATNILISQKTNGIILDKNTTNENGIAFIEVTPALYLGDTLVASGNGVVTKEVVITEEMISSNNIIIALVEDLSNLITNPCVSIIDNSPLFTQNMIELKITAENHSSYRIIDYSNSNDTVSAYSTYMPEDSLISHVLSQVGVNYVHVRFLGNDTVDIVKELVYNPNPTVNDIHTIVIVADDNSLNTQMFINGDYVSNITDNIGSVTVPFGFQQFSFVKENYVSTFVNTYDSDTIYLSLQELSPTSIEQQDFLPEISVSPNPSSGIIRLEGHKSANNIYIVVSNLHGVQVVKKQAVRLPELWSVELDLSNCKSGMYLMKILLDDHHIVKKIIKN